MKPINKFLSMIFCSMCLFGFAPMANAANMFMHIEDIPGDSPEAQHAGWFDVLSVEWGLEAAAADKRGSSGEISDIKITIAADASSPYLALACMQGTYFPTVDFDFVDESGQVVRTLRLSDVRIQSLASQSNSSRGIPPTETVTLNYSKIEWRAYPADPEQAPSEFVWKRANGN